MHSVAMVALLALQCLVVLFVALHNWIPLGRLNNVTGVWGGVSYRQTSRHHVDQFHSVCDRTCCHRLLLWQSLSGLGLLVVVDQLRTCIRRIVQSLVDAVSPSPGSTAGRTLPNDVRGDTFDSAGQRHPAEYAACAL